MTSADLAVVGAGPAGLAAAVAAAEHGLTVLVVDEQPRPGGQIFRQLPPEFGPPKRPAAGSRWGAELIAGAERDPRISWVLGSTAFGVLRDGAADGGQAGDGIGLAVHSADGAELHTARRLLIATGAADLPVAFPGWTLPGVLTAGAVQGFIKSQRLLAAQRLVLAGSHPILLVVADQLLAEGADIAEIAFARGLPRPSELRDWLPAVPGHVGLLAEAGRALLRLLRAGVRICTSTVVTAAEGRGCVDAVTLAEVDRDWNVVGHPRRIAATGLVLGYGFQPATELARQVGCALHWEQARGGWTVAHDERMRTSVPDVYVAGEPTGIGGAEQSRAEGTLAGLAVAHDIGWQRPPGPARRLAGTRRRARSATRFASAVQQSFAPNRSGLAALSTADTVVCRCELVTRGELSTALSTNPFLSTVNALKLECRSGMGVCQGRYCEGAVAALVVGETGRPYEQVGYFSAHLPIRPVPVAAMTALSRIEES